MADRWVIDITDFLDEHGDLICGPPEAQRLAEFLTSIILMATYPAPYYPREYGVSCRRRPGRKPCRTELMGFVLPDTDTIAWTCPACGDNGLIYGWRGTVWDMSETGATAH